MELFSILSRVSHLLLSLQLFINGVAYTSELPPSQTSLLLSGLHGDKMYDLHLEVYSTEHAFLPLKSNTTVRNNYTNNTCVPFPRDFHLRMCDVPLSANQNRRLNTDRRASHLVRELWRCDVTVHRVASRVTSGKPHRLVHPVSQPSTVWRQSATGPRQ